LSKGIADRKMGLKGPSRTDDFNKHKKSRKNAINEMAVEHILEEYGKASTPMDTSTMESPEAMQEDTTRRNGEKRSHATSQQAQNRPEDLTGAHAEPRQEQ
jgi:hypothetical protein